MKSQYVANLEEGAAINDYFAVVAKNRFGKYSKGTYFSLDIADKTGTTAVVFWGVNEQSVKELFGSIKINDIISIKNGYAKTSSYSGKVEINVNENTGQIIKEENYDLSEFVKKVENLDAFITQFKKEVDNIRDNDIKRLLKSFFDDGAFMKKYSETPAAKTHHHNYIGGLIQHVLSMINLSKTLAKEYEPDLNLDLMIAGCILHDIGKTVEYETKSAINYSITGSLLGHIQIGSKMVEDKIEELGDFPEILKNKILHMILSHHGSQEAGSPVIPHFPEATALHKIDDCDAQVKFALQVKKELLELTDDEIVKAGKEFGFMYMK